MLLLSMWMILRVPAERAVPARIRLHSPPKIGSTFIRLQHFATPKNESPRPKRNSPRGLDGWSGGSEPFLRGLGCVEVGIRTFLRGIGQIELGIGFFFRGSGQLGQGDSPPGQGDQLFGGDFELARAEKKNVHTQKKSATGPAGGERRA